MKYFGVDYYPELYKEDIRDKWMDEDIKLMKETGFNVVRIAEFTWFMMEKEDGVYDFEWLNHIVNKLGENGIYSIICTPTAAPPVWMAKKYPEICYEDQFGYKRPYGGRHFKCNSNSIFAKKTKEICEKLGEQYGKNPYVLGFQIDNEMAQEGSGRCECPECKKRFRIWLKDQYKTVDRLNECWGTDFWGQAFTDFEDVNPPVTGERYADNHAGWHGTDNPSLRLDFDRFSSEGMIQYYELQQSTLEKYTDKPVTHNTTHYGTNKVSFRKMLANSKIGAVDHYPNARGEDHNQTSAIYSFARNLRGGNFWLLETLCGGGHGNWAYQGMAMATPDTFRQNMAYAYVSGAELITVFKWTIFRAGFEQLGSALIDGDRIPRRRYYEMKAAHEDMKYYQPIVESTKVKAEVAIVMNMDSLWNMAIKPIHADLKYQQYIQDLYKELVRLGIGVDVIDESRPLEGYKLVVIPFAAIMPAEFETKMRQYTEEGGHVLATCLSFSKDWYGNAILGECIPYHLTDFFGMRVGEVEPVFDSTASKISDGDDTYTTKYWQEVLEPLQAKVVATYANTFRTGQAVYTVNTYGKGEAWYQGAVLEEKDSTKFFAKLCEKYQIKRAPIVLQDEGVDVVTRTDGENEYYFVFNAHPTKVTVPVQGTFLDYMTGNTIENELPLEAKAFAVLKKQ